jgi:hypothetical protein
LRRNAVWPLPPPVLCRPAADPGPVGKSLIPVLRIGVRRAASPPLNETARVAQGPVVLSQEELGTYSGGFGLAEACAERAEARARGYRFRRFGAQDRRAGERKRETMSRSLRRRIERLEAAWGNGEVTLEELVLWSYEQEPFDAETQRRYDDFERRCEHSKLCKLIETCRDGWSA